MSEGTSIGSGGVSDGVPMTFCPATGSATSGWSETSGWSDGSCWSCDSRSPSSDSADFSGGRERARSAGDGLPRWPRCRCRSPLPPFPPPLAPATTAVAATAAAASARLVVVGAAAAGLDGVVLHDHSAALAVLTVVAERLEQAGADALAGHLHQAQRGHLGDLVAGAVPAQALHQSAEHEVAVGLEDHVDEVDDDDAADVAEPELADDLLRRLEVVLGDRLLEVAAGAGELAGVDVDDGHRLGAVDDQRAARGQPDLAVEALGDLLVDAVRREQVLARVLPSVAGSKRSRRSWRSGATCET